MAKKKEIEIMPTNELLEFINSNFLLSLLDLLHVNFSFIDPDGNYIIKNNTITEELIHDKTKAQEVNLPSWLDCVETMRLAQRRMVEEEYQGKYFFSIKQPIYIKDICRGIVVMSLDITERKHIEQREQKALAHAEEHKIKTQAEETLRRAISILAGSIAHDLRVPLASMSITVDLFTRYWTTFVEDYTKLMPPENKDILQLHKENIETLPVKMKNLVFQMDEFIGITLKSMQNLVSDTLSYEDFVVCSVESCLTDALYTYPFKETEKKLINLDIQDPFYLSIHPVLFYRVIFNLIRNSLEQIEKNKKGQIFISTEKGDNYNLLRFRDTAGGASKKVVKHLFDGYKTTKKEGTGVGLAFCKLTMQNFNGDITCHSVEGDYIEFVLFFPVLPDDY